MINNLFFVNKGTALVISSISSIEIHPNGKAIIFMNNGRTYSASAENISELMHMIVENNKENEDSY